jgi:hypothetical protein
MSTREILILNEFLVSNQLVYNLSVLTWTQNPQCLQTMAYYPIESFLKVLFALVFWYRLVTNRRTVRIINLISKSLTLKMSQSIMKEEDCRPEL